MIPQLWYCFDTFYASLLKYKKKVLYLDLKVVFLFLRLGEDGDDTGGDVRNTWDNGSRKRIGFWQDKARIGSRQLRQVEMAIMIFYLSNYCLSSRQTFPAIWTLWMKMLMCTDTRSGAQQGPPWGPNASRCKDVKWLHCNVHLHNWLLSDCTGRSDTEGELCHRWNKPDCKSEMRWICWPSKHAANKDHRWWHPIGSNYSPI